MIQSRFGKLVLGVLTLLPIAYLFYFMSLVIPDFGAPNHAFDKQQFNILFKLHLSTMALIVGLLVFYITHLFRTDSVANDKKALWAIVLFLGNVIAMVVYWFLYIWPSGSRSNNA